MSAINRIKRELLFWVSKYKTIPSNYPIAMSEAEQDLMIRYLKESQNYLEFGAGASTFLALMNSDAQVTSVESSKSWIKKMESWRFIRQKERENRLSFRYVDIGKTGLWGKPVDESRKGDYPKYSADIFASKNNFDVVLIDGRFRVACAAQAALNCAKDVKIFVHDYSDRPEYAVMKEFMVAEDAVDSLVLFKPKEDIEEKFLMGVYEKYKAEWR